MENKNTVRFMITGFLTCIHTPLKNSLHPRLQGSHTPSGCQSASQNNTPERQKPELCHVQRITETTKGRVEVKTTCRVLLNL